MGATHRAGCSAFAEADIDQTACPRASEDAVHAIVEITFGGIRKWAECYPVIQLEACSGYRRSTGESMSKTAAR